MTRWLLLLLLAAGWVSGQLFAADWNQWRGPNRDGVLPGNLGLAESWPEDGPRVLWDSEFIPSNDDGGHGSVIVAGGRAFVSVVWHRDVPTETRAIDHLVLRRLGYSNTQLLGEELVKKAEADRLSLSPRLRGGKLDDWIAKWREENLDEKQDQVLGNWIGSRFKKGKAALPIEVLERLNQIRKRRFDNQAEMEAWLEEQNFGGDVEAKILAAVPNTMKVAGDVVMALDLKTGKTLWKFEDEGQATGRTSSSTPCYADGRVYSVGSTQAYCVDARDGKLIWSAKLHNRGAATSPLVFEGKVFMVAGILTALDAETGELLWEQKKVAGRNNSPTFWRQEGKTRLIVNERRSVACVNPEDGEIVWTAPGGGDSTPVIQGDLMVAYSRKENLGLAGYRLHPDRAEVLWSHALGARRTQSSPVIHDGHAYLLGADNHLCVNLETGSLAWSAKLRSNISSPILADDKLFVFRNNGSDLMMLKATAKAPVELGIAKVRALWCPSPCIADGRLLLRLQDRVRCYDLINPAASGE